MGSYDRRRPPYRFNSPHSTRPPFLTLNERQKAAAFDAVLDDCRTTIGGSPGDVAGSTPQKSYVLAMTARTGSTLLCALLEQSGLLGRPDEYVNPRGPVQMFYRHHPASNPTQYLSNIARAYQTPNGVFGLKTTFSDLEPVLKAVSLSSLLGPIRFIALEREDMIAQAVSLQMAKASGVWHRRADGSSVGDGQVRSEALLSVDSIVGAIDELVRGRLQWERFFALYGIRPLRLTYEQLVAAPAQTIARIAAHVGVELDGFQPDLSRAPRLLADARNEALIATVRDRYRL